MQLNKIIFFLIISSLTLHLKQSLCHLASSAMIALSEMGRAHPAHLAANICSKSSLQYGLPSRSKNDWPDIGLAHGPPHVKWYSCQLWPSALIIFCVGIPGKTKIIISLSTIYIFQSIQIIFGNFIATYLSVCKYNFACIYFHVQ